MKRKYIGITAAVVVALAVGAAGIMAQAGASKGTEKSGAKSKTEAKKPVPQTLCPVMGNPIDKKLYVDAEGNRIYVCCEDCLGKVKADPKTYIKKMKEEGISIAKTPKNPKAQPAPKDKEMKDMKGMHEKTAPAAK